jgi:hypothetical protein
MVNKNTWRDIEMTKKFVEKRSAPRLGLEVKIRLSPIGKNSNVYGWLQDLSKGGFKLRPELPSNIKGIFKEGDKILFETYEDFFKLKGQGGIIWTSVGDNVLGIKFDDLDEESKKALEDFLKICFRENL